MEEEMQKKKSKKILGIPIFLFTILSVAFVVAAVVIVYIYIPSSNIFTKTLTANIAGTRNVNVEAISFQGDDGNDSISCDNSLTDADTCDVSTNDIALINHDPNNAHNCTIDTQSDVRLIVSYTDTYNSKIYDNQTSDGTNNENQATVTLSPSDNLSFKITYTVNETGVYPIKTRIDCP